MSHTQFWHGELQCPVCEDPLKYEASHTPPGFDDPGDADVELDPDWEHFDCVWASEQEDHLIDLALRHEGECECQRDHK